jgi:23S rRNA (adenine2030-N6)-methyltransferase
VLAYRHAFHAGGAADVLKHACLIFCLDYLGQKEKPFLCVDTHGGAGSYSLNEGYAAQNREWEEGIAMFLGADRKTLPGMLKRYLDVTAGRDGTPPGSRYPGSPAIIRRLLRPRDRGVCFELHPADFALLKQELAGDSRFVVRREDGFRGLKSLLPPASRRACVFIDPSYEMQDDYPALTEALREALRRFPQGVYLIWYPLLEAKTVFPAKTAFPAEAALRLPETLWALYGGKRYGVEIRRDRGRSLYGSGLVIYNPPWPLGRALEEALPRLASILGCSWTMRTG